MDCIAVAEVGTCLLREPCSISTRGLLACATMSYKPYAPLTCQQLGYTGQTILHHSRLDAVLSAHVHMTHSLLSFASIQTENLT